MIIVRSEDTRHKAQLLRVLSAIADNPLLSESLRFKGGTCAAMMGMLDRFSVDLDFDIKEKINLEELRGEFYRIFADLDLGIKDEAPDHLEFFLRYPGPSGERNTLKIDAFGLIIKNNEYAPVYLPEIDRTLVCQTKETIFANKLVAPLDRFKKRQTVAGRDVYDIHHFFFQGYRYRGKIIEERTEKTVKAFLQELIAFVEEKVSQRLLEEDLNTLLLPEVFQKIRRNLKTETLMFLRDELERINIAKINFEG
ncbi:MAG: nucleotidyl transferase AbiEii/AbiGii toxin family protein [bacterium]|nr:nucleotidyl transferase AbiEii/AbiGii toxin family protein [bacterium]